MMMYMTSEQEDRIIRDARDILERRMGVKKDIEVELHRVMYYGAYHMGALCACRKIVDEMFNGKRPKGEDWVYLKAEYDCVTSSKRNMQLWLEGTPMRFRNRVRNRKGGLEWCEAYFVE